MKKAVFTDIGMVDYIEAWNVQKRIFAEVLNAKQNKDEECVQNHLIFCGHPHVYTLGKSGAESNLLINRIQLKAKNAVFYKTDRGGDITYHGPGQLVGYPILNLEMLGTGVKEYVNKIEETIILVLKEYSISAHRLPGATGVWLGTESRNTRKICAVGVKVSRSVTMHGFAFNINTDLDYFNFINPCGFTDKPATSLQKELGEKQDFERVKAMVKSKFAGVFNIEWV